MASSVVGLFDTQDHAHYAVRQLIASGFDSRNISVVASDAGGSIRKETVDESGNLASAGAVSGATSGLLVGGLIGLLVGATALAVPPVGFVVAGPIAGLITGAGVGMVSGGLLGALIGLGIPEEEAHIYAESVRRGGILVTVNCLEAERIRVQQILAMSGAANIQDRAALYRESGFTAYDPKAPVYTADEVIAERNRFGIAPAAIPTESAYVSTDPDFPASSTVVTTSVPPVATAMPGTVVEETAVVTPDEADAFFRNDYQSRFATVGTYETFQPAYRFGGDLVARPEFRDLEWSSAEAQARQLWEGANPGTWDRYSGAVRTGWDRARSSATVNRASMM